MLFYTWCTNQIIHSKKKSTSEHLFWCFRLSQIEDSIQYLEGPNSTWKDHDPKIPVMVLPGAIWSFQVLNRVLYLWQPEAPKKVLWSTFFLRVYCVSSHFHWFTFVEAFMWKLYMLLLNFCLRPNKIWIKMIIRLTWRGFLVLAN